MMETLRPDANDEPGADGRVESGALADGSPPSRESPGASASALTAMGPVVRLGFLAVGVASSLSILTPVLLNEGSSPSNAMAAGTRAFATLVFYALIAWLIGRLLPAAAEFLERAQAAQRTAAVLESEVVVALKRLAEILERTGAGKTTIGAGRVEVTAEIRQAVRVANWGVAEELLRSLVETHPDHPEEARLAKELEDAKQSAAETLLSKVEAAREANDPERVLEFRDALVPLVKHETLRTFDRELAKWFMGLIHKRLRSGTIRPDVALLAARVAQSLDETPEGASLRAALPTLRRSAGLCARCAQPYTGIADACPNCLGGATPPVPRTAHEPSLAEDEP